ncbi:AsmA family protein [Reyranella sp.]|uniref:AsmA family protein n=1 Tax=Reyranella sp. TaxID=1929291 RepID=UPI002731C10D|nr:AsmA family protein [Reyranella sp.]MDP2375722.1 AsmA family protein [Reyranella sp.]
MALRFRKWMMWSVAVAGTLALAWSALPYLVDMQAFKPAMIAAVKDATGRELVIDGPIELSMYPVPGISARQVHFANAVGTKGAQMLDVRRVVVRPSLPALLQGRIEVGTLVLFRPTIVLETDADGKPNWEFTPGAGAAQPAGAPATGFHLAVGRLAIIRGTLSYTDPRTGKTTVAEQVRAQASVGSFDGPFTIAGTATVNGVPLTLDLKVGPRTDKGNDVAVALEVASGKLDFVGRWSGVGPTGRIDGHLSVATGLLTDFIAALVTVSGQAKPAFDSSVVGRFAFDGGVEVSPERVAIKDFKMTIGQEIATGSLALSNKPALLLDGHVALAKVDADKWMNLLAQSDLAAPPKPAPAAPAPAASAQKAPASKVAAPKVAATPPAPATFSPFPPELGLSVAIDIAELIYRKGTIRDLSLAVEVRKGVISLPRLQAVLPGDMTLRATTAATGNPAKPAAGGEFNLNGPKLRETLQWLEIDTSGVPAGRLQTLSGHGKIASAADKIQVSEATFALDGVAATGSATLTLGVSLSTVVQVQIDRFDLDGYLPEPATAAMLPAAPAVAATPAAASAPTADPSAPSFGLKAKIASLVYRGQPLKGVEADMTVQGRLLKLNGLKVADLLGAKADLRGQVSDFGTVPRVDVTFNVTAPDVDRLLDYAALPKFLNGKIGAASASGGAAGTPDALALRNVTVTMLGATAHATGNLVLGEKFRFDFASFDIKTAEASRLVSVATGRNQSGMGAISAAGSFKGNAERASFEGNLQALATAMSGKIDATLGARPNITANLKVPGTLDFDKWLGVADSSPQAAPGPAAAAGTPGQAPAPIARATTAKAIDLSALRAFDATLTLFTSAIAVGSVQVTYADLSATLRNGVLKIAKLTGQFYGGAVDFAGTVDASKQTLAIDLHGSLQGIYLGEMMRGTTGTNSFGNDTLGVAVDGKISIMNIELKGSGASPGAIRDSLAGRGQVSGYLYPSVTKGSLSFASFATGLGSIFSSEMGFNSAVLQGFINHQSTVTGELRVAGGTLTLQNHTVQGQNAVALITSHNSLTAATTDTTIGIDTGRRGPADYVMTVKGPLSSPTMSTGRGN